MLLNIPVFSSSSTLVLEYPEKNTHRLHQPFRFSIHIIFYFYFEKGSQVSLAALKLAREQVWTSLRDYQNAHHAELSVMPFSLCTQTQTVSGLKPTSLIYWAFDTSCFRLPRLLLSVLRDCSNPDLEFRNLREMRSCSHHKVTDL